MPLYHGPTVSIKIGATTYNVSKTLLCKHSPYFANMFNGDFREGKEQLADLKEIDGVVSNRSFQLLLQWIYLGRFILDKESPADLISTMIESARLADMLRIANVETQIVEQIRATVLANPPPDNAWSRSAETNAHHITPVHVHEATRLPRGHSVRLLVAKAVIDPYLHSDEFKFSDEIRDVPGFAADVLDELKVSLKSVRLEQYTRCYFKDPFSGAEIRFRQ
jgi:hypothetical protein